MRAWAAFLLLAGVLALAGCGSNANPTAPARGYSSGVSYGRLVVKNTSSRDVTCEFDTWGEQDIAAGSRFSSIERKGAMSIADMFGAGWKLDWVECGGDRIDGLDYTSVSPNITLVYSGDRFYRG